MCSTGGDSVGTYVSHRIKSEVSQAPQKDSILLRKHFIYEIIKISVKQTFVVKLTCLNG